MACAFDHVIESFRNELYAGYKTSAGVDPDLLAQFELAEEAARALGVVVWPMVEFEADDALATAAARFRDLPGVDQVVLCSPDKDLAQAVVGDRVVAWDRRRDIVLDAAGVTGKFGVPPASIPDWLALVGDAADGFPGIPGWGAKSAAAVLTRFGHIDAIPDDPAALGLPAARAARLVESLRAGRDDAALVPAPRDPAAGRAAGGGRRRPRVARRPARLRRALRRARRRGPGAARRGGRPAPLTPPFDVATTRGTIRRAHTDHHTGGPHAPAERGTRRQGDHHDRRRPRRGLGRAGRPGAIRQYMFGTTVESEWRPGSPIVWKGEWQGRAYEDKGEICACSPESHCSTRTSARCPACGTSRRTTTP